MHCNIIIQYKPTKCTFFKLIPLGRLKRKWKGSTEQVYNEQDVEWIHGAEDIVQGQGVAHIILKIWAV
jgi:hypothetical protein